jgi:hypothetical protein
MPYHLSCQKNLTFPKRKISQRRQRNGQSREDFEVQHAHAPSSCSLLRHPLSMSWPELERFSANLARVNYKIEHGLPWSTSSNMAFLYQRTSWTVV